MVSRNTTLVASLGLRIGPACEAGFSAGMRRERVPPPKKKEKKERKKRGFTTMHYINRFLLTYVLTYNGRLSSVHNNRIHGSLVQYHY